MTRQASLDLCQLLNINTDKCAEAVIFCRPEGVTVKATYYTGEIDKDGEPAKSIRRYKLIEEDWMSDKNDSDITKLKPVKNTRETLLQAALDEMPIRARLRKAKYDSLIEVGFTDPQAIELCKTID